MKTGTEIAKMTALLPDRVQGLAMIRAFSESLDTANRHGYVTPRQMLNAMEEALEFVKDINPKDIFDDVDDPNDGTDREDCPV